MTPAQLFEPVVRHRDWRGGPFPPGITVDQLVANIDLAPTILALTGATPRRVQDGVSLLPVVLDPKHGNERNFLLESENYHAVRNKSFVYVEYLNGAEELYDIAEDPFQLNSRHAYPTYDTVKEELRSRLDTLRNCAGANCN